MTVWVIERIIAWSVTVLIVVWLYLLTDWVQILDVGQQNLWNLAKDINEFVHRSY